VKILVAAFAYNEGEKIKRTLSRHPEDHEYDLMVMDDGSTDGSLNGGLGRVIVLRNETNQGIGAAMKKVFEYATDHNYDILAIQAGNDKDNPLELPAAATATRRPIASSRPASSIPCCFRWLLASGSLRLRTASGPFVPASFATLALPGVRTGSINTNWNLTSCSR